MASMSSFSTTSTTSGHDNIDGNKTSRNGEVSKQVFIKKELVDSYVNSLSVFMFIQQKNSLGSFYTTVVSVR